MIQISTNIFMICLITYQIIIFNIFEVYILIIPGFGIISTTLTSSDKSIFEIYRYGICYDVSGVLGFVI